jgi:hypothetical protein
MTENNNNDNINFDNEVNGWNELIEDEIRNIGSKAMAYKWLHSNSSLYLASVDDKITLLIIAISPFTGACILMSEYFENAATWFKLSAGIISLISGVLSGVLKMWKPHENAGLHKTASNRYTSIATNIKRQLNLHPEDREHGADYLRWIGDSYNELSELSPDPEDSIVGKYLVIARKNNYPIPENFEIQTLAFITENKDRQMSVHQHKKRSWKLQRQMTNNNLLNTTNTNLAEIVPVSQKERTTHYQRRRQQSSMSAFPAGLLQQFQQKSAQGGDQPFGESTVVNQKEKEQEKEEQSSPAQRKISEETSSLSSHLRQPSDEPVIVESRKRVSQKSQKSQKSRRESRSEIYTPKHGLQRTPYQHRGSHSVSSRKKQDEPKSKDKVKETKDQNNKTQANRDEKQNPGEFIINIHNDENQLFELSPDGSTLQVMDDTASEPDLYSFNNSRIKYEMERLAQHSEK